MKPILLTLFALTSVSFGQGSLTPPAAVAPSMKTLQQIEPRVDLLAENPPGVSKTNPSFMIVINQPGSYYLSGDLVVGGPAGTNAKPNGISINASHVTIDLNGFRIVRAAGELTSGAAITTTDTHSNLEIENGHIIGTSTTSGFTSGIFLGKSSAIISNLTIEQCGRSIRFSGEGLIQNVIMRNNSSGIDGSDLVISNCIAENCGVGFFVSGSNMTNCIASFNKDTGISASDSLIHACTATNNSATGISASNSNIAFCTSTSNASNWKLTNSTSTSNHPAP